MSSLLVSPAQYRHVFGVATRYACIMAFSPSLSILAFTIISVLKTKMNKETSPQGGARYSSSDEMEEDGIRSFHLCG